MTKDLADAGFEIAPDGHLGNPFRFIAEVGSTNTEALAWAAQGAPDGATVATDHQTAGRGRWRRSWVSAPGALLQFSLVLRPSLRPDQLGLITTALGVACAEAVEALTGLTATIKWPNDVMIGGRKVAGILVESRLVGSVPDVAIAGMGVNVGWSRSEIPPELRERATSLAAELEEADRVAPTRGALLREILRSLEPRYRFLPHSAAGLIEAASARSNVLGRDVVVALSDDATVSGRATRLSPAGELEIVTHDGPRSVAMGEIRQLR